MGAHREIARADRHIGRLGKTTLFNCITGVETRDEGTIRFRGQRIDGLAPLPIFHLGMERTFQIIRVFPELTAPPGLIQADERVIEAYLGR